MRRVRLIAVIWACKICALACRLAGRNASSAPGYLALRLYPRILSDPAFRVKNKIVAVCGTNGKTTTNNLINAILKSRKEKVACNDGGSNMITGVVSAYLRRCGFFGKFKADWACLEIDEAYASKIFDCIKPDYMAVTNIFCDQTDRYGGPEAVAELLREAAEKSPDTVLLLNADDPLCAGLKKSRSGKCVFFGIEGAPGASPDEKREERLCSACRQRLKYKCFHYGTLGDYFCENCGFARPVPDFAASDVRLSGRLEFNVGAVGVHADLKGLYNVYNILAAFSLASVLNVCPDNINDVLSEYKPAAGRMEEFTVNETPVILNLVKNAVGFNQAVYVMVNDPRRKNVVIILNDLAPDGRDISWIEDAGFELMAGAGFVRFAACGFRAEDLASRMTNAGLSLNAALTDIDVETAIEKLADGECGVLYILSNFTPLAQARRVVRRLQKKRPSRRLTS